MNKPTLRRMLTCLAVTGLTLGLAPRADAQPGRSDLPIGTTIPKPRGDPKATPYTSILTAAVITGVVVIVTLLPSKRGHQD